MMEKNNLSQKKKDIKSKKNDMINNISHDGQLFKIEDLFVEYRTLEGTYYAVNGLNLELDKGDALGLVGETGAGKTTTVLSILSLLPKQGFIPKGKIIFNGKNLLDLNINQIRNIRGNQISMIFQDPMSSLNPIFSVGHQIAETVKVHNNISWKEANKEAIEMLESVGISSDRAKDFPHQFSGGMIQRVMIAISLACKPRLLIADEPTTALDVTIQAQMVKLMKELKIKYKTSLIFITHDLGIVPDICDNIAVMYAGRIVEKGVLESVFINPLHPYTKGLFNCIPDVDKPNKKLIPIPGLSPSSKYLPKGCAFYLRCDKRMKICKDKIPLLINMTENKNIHYVACFEYS